MSSFPAAMSHCLRNLLRFAGRDTRSQFWFYVLGLMLAQQLVAVVAMVPLFFSVFQRVDRIAAAQANGVVDLPSLDGRPLGAAMAPADVFANFRWFIVLAIVTMLLGLLLLAAAVARRLHDRGLAGWWGLMPVPFALAGMVAFTVFTAQLGAGNGAQPDGRVFALMFVNNAVYLLAIVALIVLLVQGSDPGANRFGPPPPMAA